MSLGLDPNTPDLFSRVQGSTSDFLRPPRKETFGERGGDTMSVDEFEAKVKKTISESRQASATPQQPTVVSPSKETIGGVLSAVLKDDKSIRSQLTSVEQAAIDTVIAKVGTPDEYPSAAEYVLRALPFVKATTTSLGTTSPVFPSQWAIQVLMSDRFISADSF